MGILLFVLFVAVLNLAVGYALGAGIGLSSLMQLLPQRDEKPVIADIDDAAPLSRAAPSPVATPTPVTETTPVAEPTPAPAAEASTPAPSAVDSSAVNVMASLRDFREKLNSASVELKLNQEDPEKFGASATKLQEANHDYLEEAGEAIKKLDELGAAGDTAASATREAVTTGVTEVEAISHEIDDLIESGLENEETRQKLVDKSETLSEVAIVAEKTVTEAAELDAPDPETSETADHDPHTDEIDRLFDHLESLLAEAQDDAVSHVAVVRVDALTDSEPDEALTLALEESIGAIAKELLDPGQTFVPGHPAMMLLEGDVYDQALERVEQLRQQVEATTFAFGEQEVRATVTCAFADARKGHDRDQVMRYLDEALGESTRTGGNKTFHHDGAFPTETPRAKVAVEPRTLALSKA
ncbi:hypothetical protein [Botrimarina mediterranea]|uniref:Diguanylate cyclase n=1 Tax=Botrimarina mediterranea TaxID=2528022 RepID=A0A518K3A3_9BACT|nr:hypothetical protein [Botrimarina mediterranea]QDV72283.1 diguanylate cyclase [Botrimarina mediterranea]